MKTIAQLALAFLALVALFLVAPSAPAQTSDALDPALARSLPVMVAQSEAPNPCAAKNPCGANACNPCAGKNPCGANACNPCAGKNPCGANPCNPCGGASVDPARFKLPEGTRLAASTPALIAEGEALWNDRSLGKAQIACSTCHVGGYGQMNASFAEPYPHRVAMPEQQAGVSEVSAAEMVNFCMIVPLQSEPLAANSRELAALAAYVEQLQSGYQPAANPCAGRNPCNPCAANPCSP